MKILFLIVLYFIGGAGSAQQSSLLDLYFTKRPPDSYLVFCTPQIPEEWVTQLHWKEEHANGTYSVMAVLNPHWGNYTKFPYQEAVKLHIKDGKTYMMEIIALEIYVCCEVVTFPSGSILENCITLEENTDVHNLRYAILGTSVVGGFFVLGSFVLICHICWMRKHTSRVFSVRGPRQQVWPRRQRSHVPYRRTLPSMNLAYEPPHDTDLPSDTPLPARTHLLLPHLTSQAPAEDLPPRNPTMNSHWPSKELSLINPSPLSFPPPRNNAAHEVLPTPQQIYGNIHHRNKQYPKAHHGKSLQIAPTINQNHPEMFSYESTDTSTVPYYHAQSRPWLFKGTSCSSEDTASQHSSRINTPRPPDSPFITINPMYHSGTGWTPHPKNAHLKYERALIS